MTHPGSPDLTGATSPFLRHGAEQPVAWMPWGEAALERARREDRPLLLDIGAVWCHWCHVMDRESYDDPETAALINELFVPVKVDRDERPDVDARYQRAVQVLVGQGGWPLTAFLMPDGQVFYGGTYFPPTDSMGRPSFRRVLQEVARIWAEQRDRAHQAAKELSDRMAAAEQAWRKPGQLSVELCDAGVEALAEDFDFRNGGFGRAPKFPNAGGIQLLLDRWIDTGEAWQKQVVVQTLAAMGRGGIHDQLGGGFHRYSTDARWLVPHFEKMASDNGPLLTTYARASVALADPFLRQVAESIVAYYAALAPELGERGGFPASQDADVAARDDGEYWTWTEAELQQALGGDEALARAARLRYGLDDDGARMPSDPERHVLFLARTPTQVAELVGMDAVAANALLHSIEARLRAARSQRPRPFVDTTLYADQVAAVASGHVAAARHLSNAPAGAAAIRALERVWNVGFQVGSGVQHHPGDAVAGAYLSDQACVLQALLDVFELMQCAPWLERAEELATVLIARFQHADGNGFVDRPADADALGPLGQEHRPLADSPSPSGNSVAALSLLRLEALTGVSKYGDAARRTLQAFAGVAPRLGGGAATYFQAVDWTVGPLTTVVVVGTSDSAMDDPLFRAATGTYRPRMVIRWLEPASEPDAALPAELRAMLTGQAPRAYVCTGHRCAPPVDAPAALIELLASFRG
jgi:uncharacterized protein